MSVRVLIANEIGIEKGDLALLKEDGSNKEQFLWIDIEGRLTPYLEKELKQLGCHELAIEYYKNARQSPRVDSFPGMSCLLFKEMTTFHDDYSLDTQYIGFFIGDGFIITIHPHFSNAIHDIWYNADLSGYPSMSHIAINILDRVAQNYLVKIQEFEDKLENIEDRMQAGKQEGVIKELINYQFQFRKLHRIFGTHQNLVVRILGEKTPYLVMNKSSEELHEWTIFSERYKRLNSLTRMYYEISGDLLDGHLSISTHDLNNTMKVLTMITAVFVPLSFIAGIYGMNFENMPELAYENAYYYALGGMAVTALGFLGIFKIKKWI